MAWLGESKRTSRVVPLSSRAEGVEAARPRRWHSRAAAWSALGALDLGLGGMHLARDPTCRMPRLVTAPWELPCLPDLVLAFCCCCCFVLIHRKLQFVVQAFDPGRC